MTQKEIEKNSPTPRCMQQARVRRFKKSCSPLGMIKKYPTFIEETALLEDKIYVSTGERGYQICLNPEDLRRAAEAEFKDFV